MADGPPVPADEWFSFLLVRLGTYVASGFAEALAPLGIEPRHFGILNRIAAHEGASQQELATLLGLHPTRMVFAVDELEERGLVERRRNPNDRRSYALHLTPDGRKLLQKARGIAGKRAGELGKGLTARERKELTRLLQKVSDEQGLAPEGLPMVGGPPPRMVKKVSTRQARRAGTAAT